MPLIDRNNERVEVGKGYILLGVIQDIDEFREGKVLFKFSGAKSENIWIDPEFLMNSDSVEFKKGVKARSCP